jgi:hypothetical protein
LKRQAQEKRYISTFSQLIGDFWAYLNSKCAAKIEISLVLGKAAARWPLQKWL